MPRRDLHEILFAARGWILALPLVVILAARLNSDAPLRPEWLLYVAAAAAIRLWAGAHLGDHGNGARAEAPRLARTGPYRISRNPLYVSNILAAAGLALFANALPLPASLALILLVILHHAVIVRHEEKTLLALHGDAFARYVALTPRWYGLMRPLNRGENATHEKAPSSAGEKEANEAGVSAAPSTLLRRQGRNLSYMALCVLALWAAARW